MTVSHCLLVRLIASAISCAKQAGIIIQDIHRSRQFMTVWKSFDDPQTEGDRASQRCIQGSLQKKFGSLIHIIGEEEDIRQRIRLVDQIRQVVFKIPPKSQWTEEVFDEDVPDALRNPKAIPSSLRGVTGGSNQEVVVWVDPLDGTRRYLSRGEERVVSVIIGIAVNGKAVGGVLHAPFYKPVPRTVWALGPLTNAVIAERCPPGRGMTVVLSEGETKATLLCTRKIDADFIMASGAGHKVLMVLDGLADAYLSPHPWTSKWDVCASDAILRAIGGVMTDAVGRPILYHKLVEPRNLTGMLASRTPEIHKRILKQVPFAVREELIWNERAP